MNMGFGTSAALRLPFDSAQGRLLRAGCSGQATQCDRFVDSGGSGFEGYVEVMLI